MSIKILSMFDLEIYENNGHFFYSEEDELESVCNASKSGIGVYLVYALKNGKVELVYVGSSGKVDQKGNIRIRNGGMYDRLVNGKQFDKPRKTSWKEKLKSEKIEALDVYWYETFDNNYRDIPSTIEGVVIQDYFQINGELPRWNKEY